MKKYRFRDPSDLQAGQRTRVLIWLFALFVIAAAWFAPFQRLEFERRQEVAAEIRENEHRAIMLEQYVTRTLDAADIATLHIAARYLRGGSRIREASPARPALLAGPIATNRAFLGLSLADRNGDLVASTLGERIAGRNVRAHEAFQVHVRQDTGRLYISRPAYSRTFGRDVIWLTRRVNNADGSFAGVVAINIEPAQLIGFLEGVASRPTDVIAIVGLDGITRARSAGNVISSGQNLAGTRALKMQGERPHGTYVGPGAADGQVRYYSHRRLSGYPLFATYGILEQDVLGPVEERARLFMAVALLVTVVTLTFAFVLSSLLGRRDRWAAEVAETNRRLEEAQRLAQIGDWEFDVATRTFRWSAPLFEMYRRDPALGAPTLDEFRSMLDQESALVLDDAIRRATESGQPHAYELSVSLPDGGGSHRLVSLMPMRGPDGAVASLHGTDQDVSSRKKLDQLETEVSHLSRLTAMNAMAATLAHELNQPLAAASNFIVGSRRILESTKPNAEQIAEGMEAAQQQVQFAGEIIRRVRAMVSDEPLQLSSASVSRIIDDAVLLAESGAGGAQVAIEKDVAADARFIHVDRVQIQQVLLNLIRNAREAAESTATPRIRICSRPADNGQVLITVEDNGAGFRETNSKLFTAFASDKPDGLGLGLSISRTIIESHGGRIRAENVEGGGARVSFTVPAGAHGAE